MTNEKSARQTISDETFDALLDDYVVEVACGWDGTQSRENLTAYHRGALSARNARIDILETKQITPEMTQVYDEYVKLLAEAQRTNTIIDDSELERLMRPLFSMFVALMQSAQGYEGSR